MDARIERHTKEHYVKLAALAKKAGRSEDMAYFMKRAVRTGCPLDEDERALLLCGVSELKRRIHKSLDTINRMVKSCLRRDSTSSRQRRQTLVSAYKEKLRSEYWNLCADMLELLEAYIYLVPSALS